MKAPNGWISHDLLVWNEFDRRGFVSKGFVLEIPDLRQGSDRALDGFCESVRQFLHTLEESTHAQFRWSADSDYPEELLAYNAATEERWNQVPGRRSREMKGSRATGGDAVRLAPPGQACSSSLEAAQKQAQALVNPAKNYIATQLLTQPRAVFHQHPARAKFNPNQKNESKHYYRS
jgi:hypothetical protein